MELGDIGMKWTSSLGKYYEMGQKKESGYFFMKMELLQKHLITRKII